MTEKQYGGATGRESKAITQNKISKKASSTISQKTEYGKPKINSNKPANEQISDQQKILLAGKIASDVRNWIKPIVKKGIPLLEIAEKIESKIIELGGNPAFPVNISINEIAAHYTPSYNDETLAHGLIKIDFGVHIEGWCSDQSFSLDLENSEKNKNLIKSAEEALENAIKKVKNGSSTSSIGKEIQKTIESYGFSPITNLSGHKIGRYDLHAGMTIPNIDNKSSEIFKEGLYAIEPFSTDGAGKIKEGKPSGIYQIINSKNPRSPIAREVLSYILENYNSLPFCSRWLVKKLGTKAIIGLRQLEESGNLHNFPQLIEVGKGIVAQAEHTILIEENGKVIVTTI